MRRDKAEGQKILAALDRILEMQQSIWSGLDPCIATGLAFLSYYYKVLPEDVARRLTELHPEDLAQIPEAVSWQGAQEQREKLGSRIASDAAIAQVIRASNSYRGRLGLCLLGADGKPEAAEGGGADGGE